DCRQGSRSAPAPTASASKETSYRPPSRPVSAHNIRVSASSHPSGSDIRPCPTPPSARGAMSVDASLPFIHQNLRGPIDGQAGDRTRRAEGPPDIHLLEAELLVVLVRLNPGLFRAAGGTQIRTEHPVLLVVAEAFVPHLMEPDACALRRVSVDPGQHPGHVAAPVLPLHSQR